MRPIDKARLLRELSDAPRDSPDWTPRLVLRAIQSREALGLTGVGQGVALLAPRPHHPWARDLISGRIVRPFDLSWRPADTYWIVCPKATAKVAKIGRFRHWLVAEAADDARRFGGAEQGRR